MGHRDRVSFWKTYKMVKIMPLISFILNTILKSNEPLLFSLKAILGYFLILMGAGIGLFFLFQFTRLFIGYYAAGSFLCLLLLGTGLYLSCKKPKKSIDYPQGIKEALTHVPALFNITGKHTKEIVGLLVILGLVFSHHFKKR